MSIVKAIIVTTINMQSEYKDLINASVMFALVGMLILVM